VTIYIEDENDNAPEFIGAPYSVTVDELTPPGDLILCTVCSALCAILE